VEAANDGNYGYIKYTTVFAQTAGNELEIKGTVVSGNENILLIGSTVVIKDAAGKPAGSLTTTVMEYLD
jgi:hypothetical protein